MKACVYDVCFIFQSYRNTPALMCAEEIPHVKIDSLCVSKEQQTQLRLPQRPLQGIKAPTWSRRDRWLKWENTEHFEEITARLVNSTASWVAHFNIEFIYPALYTINFNKSEHINIFKVNLCSLIKQQCNFYLRIWSLKFIYIYFLLFDVKGHTTISWEQ